MKMPDMPLPDGVTLESGEDPQEVAEALAADVARFLVQRLERADRASLVVSGGSTPLPFFRALSQVDLDWSRVDVLLADERWVPEGDPASNTTLVRENLLQNKAADANFLSLKQVGATPEEGLPRVRSALAGLKLPLPRISTCRFLMVPSGSWMALSTSSMTRLAEGDTKSASPVKPFWA